jgi:WD40 repeat protein
MKTHIIGFREMLSVAAMLCLLALLPLQSSAFEKPEVYPQLGHADRVQSVVYSPGGNYLLSASLDSTIRLWDLRTEREVRRLIGHKDGVRCATYSPDGKQVLSGGYDKTIRLWDVETGKEVSRFLGHTDAVLWVVFSPNGKQALSGGADKSVRLWDVASGREIRRFLGHTDEVYAVAFSPDARQLLSGSTDKTMLLWDVASGREIHRFIGHMDGVFSVSFSPDGRKVLSGSSDNTVRLWDVNSGIELQRFTGQYAVSSAVFSNEGRYILAAGLGDAVLWDSWTGAKVRQLKDDVMSIYYAAAYSPDGKHVATCGLEKGVRIWEIDTGNRVLALGQPNYVSSVAVSPGSSFLAVGNSDRSIGIWNRVTGERTQLLKSHTHGIGGITAISFSPDSKYLLSGGFDNVVRLWDIASGKTVKEFKDVDTAPSSVAFSPDGKTALFTGKFYTLSLYDLSSGRQIQSIKQKNIRIVSGAFSPDGKQLLSDDGDDSIIILDRTTGKEIRKIKAFTRALNSAVFSPDGRSILAGGGDDIIGTENDVAGVVRLWDRATGRKLQELKGHRWFVASVAFSPDGTSALSGGSDATIRLWSLATGKQQSAFMGHASGVTSLSFFPDGKQVVSGSEDGTVRVWAVASGKELVQLINFPNGEWVAITPEGYYNASPNGDKHLNVRVGPNVYGIENYRETFFRPDLVKLALGGGSLQGYRTLADVKQPPKVSIVQTPVTSATEEFKLTLKLEEQGGGVGDVRLFLNGSAIMLDSARSLKAVQKEGSGAVYRSYTLKLSPGSNTVRAIAFNADNSMQSNEAVHQVQASFAAIRKPTLHALVIGIQEFRNPKLQLTYAVADANLFAETLRTGASGLFEQVKVTLLTSRDATSRDAVVSALQRYQTINPDDLFILYIASHGTVDEGEYYLITSNVGALSTQRLNNDALSQTELKELVANIPSTKKLIVIDTCNAGQLGQAMQTALLSRGMSEDTAMKVLSRAVGSTILSASTSVQEALEGYQGHGLFTWALVQGLQGKADKGKTGYVRTTDLAAYVEDEVPNMAEKIFKRAQFPTVSISGQGFPVGRVR